MRRPSFPPPEVTLKPETEQEYITQIRKYKLITPLFGGGVEAGKPDENNLIRGAAVRGHLRFWWRATQGGRFNGDLAAMKQAEDKLWGAAANKANNIGPSKIHLFVSVSKKGQEEYAFDPTNYRADRNVAPDYAAFPLNPTQEERRRGEKVKPVRTGVEFTLKIGFPKNSKESVEAALWAWENFGGVGARTRRGFGALELLSIGNKNVTINDIKTHINDGLEKYVVSGTWPDGVPYLTVNNYRICNMTWHQIIGNYKRFRQSRNQGNDPRRPGRSHWPEADAIRKLTSRSNPRHAKPIHNPRIDKFPRGVLGLPIIFHFQDTRAGNPEDTTLQGRSHERLASPLILRPLPYNQGSIALKLQMVGTPLPLAPQNLVLKDNSQATLATVDWQLNSAEARQIRPLNGNTDVIDAFLKFL